MRLALVIIATSLVLFGAQSRSETALERGRYLVDTIASCGNCHTPKGPNGPLPGKKLAGGDVIKHQDFTAVVPNITSDQETGIGKWTDDEISLAIREGKRPDGTLIGPAMPSRSYRNLGDEDVRAIVAYLRAVPAVHNPITAKSQYDATFPASWGPPVGHVNAPPKEDRIAYGAYLAAKDAGREKQIKFLGIDALPPEGVTWVCKGELTATFLYATPGAEGVRQALKVVKGENVEKKITLPTMAIDKTNCEQILKDNGLA